MSKIHYILRPARSGWFIFTLISEAGRLTGTVIVPKDGTPDKERERQAREKIAKLAEVFSAQQSAPEDMRRKLRLNELSLSPDASI